MWPQGNMWQEEKCMVYIKNVHRQWKKMLITLVTSKIILWKQWHANRTATNQSTALSIQRKEWGFVFLMRCMFGHVAHSISTDSTKQKRKRWCQERQPLVLIRHKNGWWADMRVRECFLNIQHLFPLSVTEYLPPSMTCRVKKCCQ